LSVNSFQLVIRTNAFAHYKKQLTTELTNNSILQELQTSKRWFEYFTALMQFKFTRFYKYIQLT